MFRDPDLFAYLKCPVTAIIEWLSDPDILALFAPVKRSEAGNLPKAFETTNIANAVDHPMLSKVIAEAITSLHLPPLSIKDVQEGKKPNKQSVVVY